MFVIGKGKDVNKILKRAADLVTKGNIAEAIKELRKAITLNPKDGNLYNRLGDLYIKDNNVKESINTYKKGIEAYRKDNYSRNAITLCKKILRHDPNNTESYLVIADLFVELEEKRNALTYLFTYIEKQRAQKDIKGVINTLEKVKKIGVLDKDVVKEINKIYKTIGEDNLAKEFTESITWKKEDSDKAEVTEISITPQKSKEERKRLEEKRLDERIAKLDKKEEKLKDNITHLEDTIKGIETALTELREAVRLDEVISVLDKSLVTLSNEHKKAIALLQKSLSLNLDTLQKSVEGLRERSRENVEELKPLFNELNKLNKTLENLRNNQTSIALKMNENLNSVSNSFNSTTENVFKEIKGILSIYQKATDDMCLKLDEAKNYNVSLLEVSEEIKIGIQGTNDSLTRFFMSQDVREKKQNRFIIIIIAITAAICGLLVFSVLK